MQKKRKKENEREKCKQCNRISEGNNGVKRVKENWASNKRKETGDVGEETKTKKKERKEKERTRLCRKEWKVKEEKAQSAE